MTVLKDIAYGGHERQRLDLCLPSCDTHGLILFIHGGAWIAGDKCGYEDELQLWGGRGYAAAAMNYHYLSPEYHMDTLLCDITAALAKIKGAAAEKGFDLTGVLLTGTSAGGHLSLLYAYSMAETAPIRPACVIDYCGPTLLTDKGLLYDTPKNHPPVQQWIDIFTWLTGTDFSGENTEKILPVLDRYSPVSHITPSSVPTVICHGQKDDVVPFSNAVALRDRLESCGVEYVFLPMPQAGHGLEQKEIYEESKMLFGIYAERFLR